MISFRKSDLIDRLKKLNSKKRLISFFNDDRNFKKYYDLSNDHITVPDKAIDEPFRDIYGPQWKLVDFDTCTVVIDGTNVTRRLGENVYRNDELLGTFSRVTLDGLMLIIDGENEKLIDPTDFIISGTHDGIYVEYSPI